MAQSSLSRISVFIALGITTAIAVALYSGLIGINGMGSSDDVALSGPDSLKYSSYSEGINSVRFDSNGNIDYTEFIAGWMQSYVYLKENNLKQAFQYFDRDGNGTITLEELKESLWSDDMLLDEKEIENIILEIDKNDDGMIDYKEFLEMMKNNDKMRELVEG